MMKASLTPKALPPKPRKPRRFGTENSETRTVILDAVEAVILHSGYAAITTRRVAEEAKIKPSLIHYYYKTLEDLLTATYRRAAENSLQRNAALLSGSDPLAALWEASCDPNSSALALEFMAMANHHKYIREEIARYAEQIRAIQEVALKRYLTSLGISSETVPPIALTAFISFIGRSLVLENNLGITLGHAEVKNSLRTWMENWKTYTP